MDKLNFEKPLTLEEVQAKRDKNKRAKNPAERVLLTPQEKKMLRQEKSKETLEKVEKKQRLKKSIITKVEYHAENDSTIFTGSPDSPLETETQPIDLDDMTLEHIVGKKEFHYEPIPDHESMIEEKKKLLDLFGTDNPTEIDEILAHEEENHNISRISEEIPEDPYNELREKSLAKNHDEHSMDQGGKSFPHNTWKRFKNWLSGKNPDMAKAMSEAKLGNEFKPGWQNERKKHDQRKKRNWIEKFLKHEKGKNLDSKEINDFIEKQHQTAINEDYDYLLDDEDPFEEKFKNEIRDEQLAVQAEEYREHLEQDHMAYDARTRIHGHEPGPAGQPREGVDFNREHGNL